MSYIRSHFLKKKKKKVFLFKKSVGGRLTVPHPSFPMSPRFASHESNKINTKAIIKQMNGRGFNYFYLKGKIIFFIFL